jgi:[pyruvate, water dikinase]-phosphate phosphotransferase / [pyruvate, water dikinase] kinase
LAQFDATHVEVERKPQTRTAEQVRAVVREAQECGAMVVHTLASTQLRREIHLSAAEHHVVSVDLLGSLLSDLSVFLGAPAGGVPGGLHHSDKWYNRRMDALTFAVKHDDGLGLDEIGRADIVLVGISRTSKTPLSIYLAVRGHFVANVPIIYGVEPPELLFRIEQRKIVGLRMDPIRLRQIREQRLGAFKSSARQGYTGAKHVQAEVEYADAIFRRASWPVVDLTFKSLEEVAVEVLSLATDLPYIRPDLSQVE